MTRSVPHTYDSVLLGRVGAALLGLAAVLHVVIAPEYLDEHPVYGLLFLLSLPLALVIGWFLWKRPSPETAARRRLAWYGGLALSLGMAVAFVLSRTIGLPGMAESEWAEGLPSLFAEAAFAIVAVAALLPRRIEQR